MRDYPAPFEILLAENSSVAFVEYEHILVKFPAGGVGEVVLREVCQLLVDDDRHIVYLHIEHFLSAAFKRVGAYHALGHIEIGLEVVLIAVKTIVEAENVVGTFLCVAAAAA